MEESYEKNLWQIALLRLKSALQMIFIVKSVNESAQLSDLHIFPFEHYGIGLAKGRLEFADAVC